MVAKLHLGARSEAVRTTEDLRKAQFWHKCWNSHRCMYLAERSIGDIEQEIRCL